MVACEEKLKSYKEMAEQYTDSSMEVCIMRHLEANCPEFRGNEDKFSRCIQYVMDCACEILGGEDAAMEGKLSGEVNDEVCYRMAMDYFKDEIWKKEDEEKAKEEAERLKREEERKAKMANRRKKSTGSTVSASMHLGNAEHGQDEIKAPEPIREQKKQNDGQLDLFASLGV